MSQDLVPDSKNYFCKPYINPRKKYLDEFLQSKIFTIRGKHVITDRDLAAYFEVETKEINQAVKNNPIKFPSHFVFRLTESDINEAVKKNDGFTYNKYSSVLPQVFTKNGMRMLTTILKVAAKKSVVLIEYLEKLEEYVLNQYKEHQNEINNILNMSKADLFLLVGQTLKEKEKLQVENKQQEEIIIEQQNKIEEDAPKVNAWNSVTKYNENSIEFEIFAKNLNFDVGKINKTGSNGKNTLYRILRDNGIFTKNNLPQQDYMNKCLFEVASKINPKNNEKYPYTRIFPKGEEFIIDKLTKLGFKKIEVKGE